MVEQIIQFRLFSAFQYCNVAVMKITYEITMFVIAYSIRYEVNSSCRAPKISISVMALLFKCQSDNDQMIDDSP